MENNRQDNINTGRILQSIDDMRNDISLLTDEVKKMPDKLATKEEVSFIKKRQDAIAQEQEAQDKSISDLQKAIAMATGGLVVLQFILQLIKL